MNERVLLKAAFIISLAGILALFFILQNTDYSEMAIEDIHAERIEGMIKVKGEVVSSRNSGNVTFVTIRQPSEIDIVVFDNVSLSEGENIEIIGQSEEYRNEMEIIAKRIRVIS